MALFGSDEEFEIDDEDLDIALDDVTNQINNAQTKPVDRLTRERPASHIAGSPGALKLFGITSPTVPLPESQDLFGDENQRELGLKFSFQKNSNEPSPPTTPHRKRPCLRTPQQTFSLTTPRNLTTPQLNPPQSPQTPNIFVTPSNKPTLKFLPTPSIPNLLPPENKKIAGVYSSQEEIPILQGPVWETLSVATSNEVLQPYDVKGALEGKCLYRGKAPHLAVVIKSIEQLSSTDTSVVVCDRSGEIKGTVHKRVMSKWGALLEEGVGLLLRQVTVFSLGLVKYINITLPNIVYVVNEAGLEIQQDVLDRHLLEISEVSVLRLEAPDVPEEQTPRQIMTPNIKPTLKLTPGTRSPQQTRTMSPQYRNKSPQQKSTPIRRDVTPACSNAPMGVTTPVRKPMGVTSTTPVRKPSSVRSNNYAPHHQNLTTPRVSIPPKQSIITSPEVDLSEKEKNDISQLLEGLDDDIFGDDNDLDL